MQMSFTGERYVPELRGQIYYEHFHRYAMVLELARDKDVLDIACGEGYGTAALALVAKTAVGVDLDPESVHHAAVRYTGMNVAFRAGDCSKIPAADASFDLVVSFETIEHLVEQERMLVELRRVLRPNGLLVISSPNKLVYSDARAVKNPYHKRELYFHEFRDMLRSFFPMVRMFGQRVFAASAVHPLRGTAEETRWLGPSVVAEGTLGALPDPEYFVAICASSEDSTLPDLCSVYLDPRDELLADIRAGGLEPALSAGTADGAGLQRLAPAGVELDKIEHELAERVVQVKSLEDHASGLETLLNVEQRRNHDLEVRLEGLAGELSAARENAERIETMHQEEYALLAGRVAEVTREKGELERENGEFAGRVRELEHEKGELERAKGELERENGEFAGRVRELEHEKGELEREKGELERAKGELERAKGELERAKGELERENGEFAGRVRELEHEKGELEREKGELERANSELEREKSELDRGKGELEHEREGLAWERDTARADLAGALETIARADRKMAGLGLERDALRESLADEQRRVGEEQHAAEAGALADAHRVIAQLKLERLNYDELAQRTHQAEALLADVIGSNSWRLTLPARRLMGALRKRGNR